MMKQALLWCALLLVGASSSACGGGDTSSTTGPTSTAPTSTAPTSSTSTTSGAPDGSSTGPTSSAPTSPTSPGTPAAAGPVMKLSHVVVTLPKGYRIVAPGTSEIDSFGPPQDTEIYISQDPAFGESLSDEASLIRTNTAKGLTRQPDLTIDGVRGFVFSGLTGTTHRWYFGTVTHDKAITVKVDCPTAQGFDALTATIAASITLR